MITCPNCGKENADESVHCGFCGHQLQEGGKKTMFGMAALDGDAIKAAAEAAKKAAANASQGAMDDGGAFAKTEMMPSVGGDAPGAPEPKKEDPFADEFAALEAQYGNDPSLDTPAASSSLPGLDTPPGESFSSAPGVATTGPASPNMNASQPIQSAQQIPSQANNPMVKPPGTAMEKKKNNTMVFVAIGIVVLLLLGCAAAGVAAVLFGNM